MAIARVNASAPRTRSAATGPNCLGRSRIDSTFTSRSRLSPCGTYTIEAPYRKGPTRFDRASWRHVIGSITGIVKDGIHSNAQLKPRLLKRYCGLDTQAQELLEHALTKLGLSARAHGRIVRVERTIADLAGSDKIESLHVAEAIQYRSLDRRMEF